MIVKQLYPLVYTVQDNDLDLTSTNYSIPFLGSLQITSVSGQSRGVNWTTSIKTPIQTVHPPP